MKRLNVEKVALAGGERLAEEEEKAIAETKRSAMEERRKARVERVAMEEKACAEEEAMVIEIDSAPGVPGTVFVGDYDRIQEDQPEEAHETMQMVEGVVGKQGQGAEPLFDHCDKPS